MRADAPDSRAFLFPSGVIEPCLAHRASGLVQWVNMLFEGTFCTTSISTCPCLPVGVTHFPRFGLGILLPSVHLKETCRDGDEEVVALII